MNTQANQTTQAIKRNKLQKLHSLYIAIKILISETKS